MTAAARTVPIAESREVSGHWWHDRALVALLVLFGIIAPLVTHRIYASDEIQYFAYTRSLFFDRDFDFGNEYMHFYASNPQKFGAIYTDLYLKKEDLTGLPINVAPIGTGLFWLPSYAVAHLFVTVANGLGANVPADGYSQPYITAICLTSYLLGCAGLLLCYLISRRLFGKRVSAVGVAVTWLATPLIFYTVVAPPWSHATSLFTVTLFLWYWLRTRREAGREWREWLVLGLCAGLMMLVREQDALFLIVPGLEVAVRLIARWRKSKFADRGALMRPIGGLILMGVTAAIVFIPQLVAYRAITGRFGPSKVVAGKFTWTAPNALNVLFSPEHGLVPWTPVVVLAMLGLVLLWRRDRLLTAALAVAFFVQVYIAGSFLTWQSAGSFGQRRFINSTAIFVLGLVAVLSWVLARGVPRWALGALALLFVGWNGGLLIQYALWTSDQRQGLEWATVLQGQLEMPAKAARLLWTYITDRQQFYSETGPR
ncbi:MAG TPA: glycosyltransferase family 39 protein [Chloroflexia bacterium]|nr:glycosyltransferase family 39 protein [Chloroflexia bacterium]